MKILLLEHPRSISPDRCNDIANTPLSSCLLSGYAAAMLQSKGHQVVIVEGYMDGLPYSEIEKKVADFQPDILGIHMVYHWQDDLELYAFMEKIKSTGMSSCVMVYGFYPTIAYEDILMKCSAVNAIIVGEVELTVVELVEAVADKGNLDEVAGLAVRNTEGQLVCSRREVVADMDSLPRPVRTEGMYCIPEVNIQGSRGCYGGCTFCYINPFYGCGSRWRGRSPENIIAEIDSIIAERGVRDFYFTDPNFFGPGPKGQERARRIAALLKTRNIRFGLEGRVNDIHDETIAALADAGLRHILIGLESGRDSSLKRMNKMTTVAQNEAAVKTLRKHGIEPNIGFIMFEPDATLEDISVNLEFLLRNDLLNNLAISANLLYHHQIILKGTPAFRELQKQGRLQLQPGSSYEGITSFSNSQVAVLAELMRRLTNYLFDRMSGIWGGHVIEPANAQEKYAKINQRLVEIFSDSLTALEKGETFSEERITAIYNQFKEETDSLLS